MFVLFPLCWNLVNLKVQRYSLKYSENTFFAIFEAVFKNIAEQSTPYAEKLVQIFIQKMFVILMLLCSLEISNAYKNDNILELITPKIFQPIEYFEQLVFLYYSIFLEPNLMHIRHECVVSEPAFQICVQAGFVDEHTVHYRNFSYGESSMLYITSYIVTRTRDFSKSDQGLPKQIIFLQTF